MGFALLGVESGSFLSILHCVLCNCRIRSFVSTLHYELCNCALCVAFMLLLVLKIYVLHLSVTINSDAVTVLKIYVAFICYSSDVSVLKTYVLHLFIF